MSIVDRVATITAPSADWNGAETITFRATDPGLLWDDDPATFTVTAVNDTPVVSDIPDQTIAEGSTFTTINLDGYVSDVDNLDAEMTWSYCGNTSLTVSIVDRVATITAPSADWNGAETITFRATDPGLLWDDDPATFTVTAVIYTLTLKPGWNLVAAATDTDTFLSSLFGWSGSAYVPTTAPLSWQGYWYNNDTGVDQTVEIQTTTGTHIIDLSNGWNLIGNPLGSAANLTFSAGGPTSAFVYNATTKVYVPTTTLLPGQGAWVQGATGQTVTLTPTT